MNVVVADLEHEDVTDAVAGEQMRPYSKRRPRPTTRCGQAASAIRAL